MPRDYERPKKLQTFSTKTKSVMLLLKVGLNIETRFGGKKASSQKNECNVCLVHTEAQVPPEELFQQIKIKPSSWRVMRFHRLKHPSKI